MALGFLDIDLVDEGPFGAVWYNIQLDDPSTLQNVELYFSDLKGEDTYWLADGQEDVDEDGNDVYVFNGDTLGARKVESDGSLETTTDDDGNEVAVTRRLPPGRKYVAEVTFEIDVVDISAPGARAEVQLRQGYAIPLIN